jgi:hypothetical protein
MAEKSIDSRAIATEESPPQTRLIDRFSSTCLMTLTCPAHPDQPSGNAPLFDGVGGTMREAAPAAAQFVALEQRRCQAMLAADTAALQALLAPDVTYVHSSGVRDGREGLLANLRTGAVVYEDLRFELLEVTPAMDSAIVSGIMRAQIRRGEVVRGVVSRYLAVWLRRGGDWQAAAVQCTKLSQD